jgi:hypothetical protein
MKQERRALRGPWTLMKVRRMEGRFDVVITRMLCTMLMTQYMVSGLLTQYMVSWLLPNEPGSSHGRAFCCWYHGYACYHAHDTIHGVGGCSHNTLSRTSPARRTNYIVAWEVGYGGFCML